MPSPTELQLSSSPTINSMQLTLGVVRPIDRVQTHPQRQYHRVATQTVGSYIKAWLSCVRLYPGPIR